MAKAAGNAALDRDIRRAVAQTLWLVANGRSAPGRTMRTAPEAADKAAVDLIELYETANDAVLVDLYDEWRAQARPKDASAEHFGKLLAGAAIGNKSDLTCLIDAGAPRRIPEFAIELKNGILAWTGESLDEEDFKPAKWNPSIPSQEDYLGETLGAPELVANPRSREAQARYEAKQKARREDDEANLIATMRANGVNSYNDIKAALGYEGMLPGRYLRMIDRLQRDGVIRKREDGFWVIESAATNPSGPSCPGCGTTMKSHGSTASCPRCGVTGQLEGGRLVAVTSSPRVLSTRAGRPPGVPVGNPGSKLPWRAPTIDELAKAWAYIEREYTLKEGNIDGEQWAEALAFVASHPSHAYVDADDRRIAEEMFPQLTEAEWRMIAARADYMLVSEGDKPRFKVTP